MQSISLDQRVSVQRINPRTLKPYPPTKRELEIGKRNRHYKSTYGISLDEYVALKKKQRGVCAICKRNDRFGNRPPRLHLDHSHKNGKVRGLLCHTCNIGIAYFKDNPKRLKSAAAYLMKYKR